MATRLCLELLTVIQIYTSEALFSLDPATGMAMHGFLVEVPCTARVDFYLVFTNFSEMLERFADVNFINEGKREEKYFCLSL